MAIHHLPTGTYDTRAALAVRGGSLRDKRRPEPLRRLRDHLAPAPAAQRMHAATGEVAEKYGLALRDYIVLSALDKTPGPTQGELGKSPGLDKTTLMSQLDRLERRALVVRHGDPRDRRLRIPVITEDGRALRTKVAGACAAVEDSVMNSFGQDQVQTLRRMLFTIIGDIEDRGSCL